VQQLIVKQLLGTDAYRQALADLLAQAQSRVCIVSAFVTVSGIKWVFDRINPSIPSFQLLTRWHCSDLVSGASELEVFDVLSGRGYPLFILPDLHAKVVLIDDAFLLLGSANMTNYGLKLVPGGNREMGVYISPTSDDIEIINALFTDAVKVSSELYNQLRNHINSLKILDIADKGLDWPASILSQLETTPERLWVQSCFGPQVHSTWYQFQKILIHT
jgi:hypothetical protein